MIDKWNYGIALEKLGWEEEAHDIKMSVCTSLASDNYFQKVNSKKSLMINGTYSWSRESDTHVTFYNFNAWTDTMITGDLYLNDDDSLSMYVEGDYVGKLYMHYKVKE